MLDHGGYAYSASLGNAKLFSKEFAVVYTATISINIPKYSYPHQSGFYSPSLLIFYVYFPVTHIHVFLNLKVHPHQILK